MSVGVFQEHFNYSQWNVNFKQFSHAMKYSFDFLFNYPKYYKPFLAHEELRKRASKLDLAHGL